MFSLPFHSSKKMNGRRVRQKGLTLSPLRSKKRRTKNVFHALARRRPDRGGPRQAGGRFILGDDDEPLARRHDDDLGPSLAGSALGERGGIGSVHLFVFFCCCCLSCCCSRRGACRQGPAHERVSGVPVRSKEKARLLSGRRETKGKKEQRNAKKQSMLRHAQSNVPIFSPSLCSLFPIPTGGTPTGRTSRRIKATRWTSTSTLEKERKKGEVTLKQQLPTTTTTTADGVPFFVHVALAFRPSLRPSLSLPGTSASVARDRSEN